MKMCVIDVRAHWVLLSSLKIDCFQIRQLISQSEDEERVPCPGVVQQRRIDVSFASRSFVSPYIDLSAEH